MISDMNHGKNSENNITDLTGIHELKAEDIDVSAYFLSLTDNAFNIGLLTEKDINDMQSQIYSILSDNIWMHTNGTSTSVTSKEANGLMLAILHTLDSFCIFEINLGRKLTDLVKDFKEKAGIKKCYDKGLEFINKTSAKELAKETAENEPNDILDSFDEYDKTVDFDELDKLDEYMDFEKNKIISQSTMSDMEFNMLCDKILKCKTAGQKTDMIINSISSAVDFLDILSAQCLFGEEYLVLYEKLLGQSPETIEFLINNLENREEEWQEYLIEFAKKTKILD